MELTITIIDVVYTRKDIVRVYAFLNSLQWTLVQYTIVLE